MEPTSIFNLYEASASFLFWLGVISLVFFFPLKHTAKLFGYYIRSVRGAVVFFLYLGIHLFLYGLLLEGIVIYLYKVPQLISRSSISFTAILTFPETTLSILSNYAYNPSLNISVPPSYSFALSLYSLVIAVTIAVLVVTNVMKVSEMASSCTLAQRSRAIVLLPALGVAGGAACCLSIPLLISLAVPSAAILSESIWAYYIAYLGFPLATAVALKYNLDTTERLDSKFRSSESQ
ncbi:MAG: hypothetical protein JRN67_04610 [Nitrososphaerota archaeon]|nr:hypothetical protein [Nitrososphaerota archaeon]